MGSSDHVTMMMELKLGYPTEIDREEYKEERYNFYKADYNLLRDKFKQVDWSRMQEENTIEGKYKVFKQVYEEVIDKNVPKKKEEPQKKKPWYNDRCMRAKKKRDRAWEITRKRKNQQTW